MRSKARIVQMIVGVEIGHTWLAGKIADRQTNLAPCRSVVWEKACGQSPAHRRASAR
jgi:hypothetical protein